MLRSKLKNIVNRANVSKKTPFDKFKESLPFQVEDNYRLEAAWKAYGKPVGFREAIWEGLIQPLDENNYKLPSIGYNEETEEYEYLNKGKENDIVAKDIRVWDNDVIPFVKELKHGGYVRTFNEEKDCWTYSKNSQKEEFKTGGKITVLMADGSGNIVIDTPDADLKAGRKPIGSKNGKNLYLNGDGKAVYAENSKENPEQTKWMLKGGKTLRNIELLITYANNLKPPFILRILNNDNRAIPLIMEDGKKYHGTHLLNYGERNGKTYVFPEILDFDGDLIRLNWPFNLDTAIEKGDYLEMDPKEAELFTKEYKKFYPNYKPFKELNGGLLEAFKQGGQMNVIPEGALHARKNGMELAKEGEITHKGIPVVTNDGELVAEIEKNEIIFIKEVTDKIEKAYKKFYDEETSSSEKDELALKIGKFLTDLILNNTEDKTGLILEVEEKQ